MSCRSLLQLLLRCSLRQSRQWGVAALSSVASAFPVVVAGADVSSLAVSSAALPAASGCAVGVSFDELASASTPSAWLAGCACSTEEEVLDAASFSAANAAVGNIMGHIATLTKTEMTLFALLVFMSSASSLLFPVFPIIFLYVHSRRYGFNGKSFSKPGSRNTALHSREALAHCADAVRLAVFLPSSIQLTSRKKRRVPPFFQGTPSVGAIPIKTRHFANDMHGFALFRNGEFARFELGHDVTSVQERFCV